MATGLEFNGLVLTLPSWTTYAAVAVSGLAGATYAAKRGFDVIGVFGIAFATGLGGLLIRDLLITTGTPNILTQPLFVVVAFWTALIGFFFAGLISRFDSVMVILDGLAMGFLCTLGAGAALRAGLAPSSAVLVGVLTAVGGPILRDILAGTAPTIVRPGYSSPCPLWSPHLYSCCSSRPMRTLVSRRLPPWSFRWSCGLTPNGSDGTPVRPLTCRTRSGASGLASNAKLKN